MKYGILTFHNIPNIGALLQAQALCQSIRNLGEDCSIIDYTCDNIFRRELQKAPSGNLLNSVVQNFIIWPKTKRKIKACQEYMSKQKLYTSKKYNKKNLNELNTDIDVFVSGSDMIWNLEVTDHDWTYMCDFALDSKKRISYGSSIGDVWQDDDLCRVKNLLSKYSAITVREQDTCDTINRMGIACQTVSDPTMLLTPKEWRNFASNARYKKYVLVYFPSPVLISSAQAYAKKNNLKVLVITNGLPQCSYKTIWPLDPPEWISLFLNADAVFTNSYHGLLFSLYFEKPVWTANYGNRIASLLSKLNIEKAMLKNDPTVSNNLDFDNVKQKIESFRQESLTYLKYIIQNV